MQHDNQGRPVLVGTVMVLIVLVFLLTSVGVGWLVATWSGNSRRAPTRLGPVAVLPTTSATPSVEATASSSSVSTSATPVPSATKSVQPINSTTPSAQPSATSSPPAATPSATPTVNISVVTVTRAYIYDSSASTRSIIGGVERGDELEVLGQQSTWYLVRVYRAQSSRSRIEGGQGWIAQNEVSPPSLPVPVVAP